MSEREFWHMTLHELDVLTERYKVVQWRADRRAVVGAWVLANVNRDSDARREPFTLEEVAGWLGHGFAPAQATETQAPPEGQTLETLRDTAILLNEVYGGRRLDE